MAGPYAIRVRTPDGWQDLALTGPTGPAGQGRELVDVSMGTDQGPTGVSTSSPGDALVSLGSVTTRAVPHWFDLSLVIQGNAAGAIAFLLYEGTTGSPGSYVGQIPVWVDGARPTNLHGRLRFGPAAGTRNYHVRWLNIATGSVLFTIWGGSYYNGHATIREVAS